ncbi:MAG: hypothetical protein WC401_09575 [Bacteroidales bacterium]
MGNLFSGLTILATLYKKAIVATEKRLLIIRKEIISAEKNIKNNLEITIDKILRLGFR